MTETTDTLTPARIEWRDGEPFNLDAGDWYSSTAGALAEAEHVFLDGNDLGARWDTCPRIGELGFGTGLNFLASVRQWLMAPRKGWLHYTAAEQAPLTTADQRRSLARWPEVGALANDLLAQMPPPQRGFHLLVFPQWRVRLLLLFDEATAALHRLEGSIDAWFLDGFAPARNPDMWSEALWREVRRLSTTGTSFATYSAAGHVRRGLNALGFQVSKRPGFGRKRDMLVGRLPIGASQSSLPPWFARPDTPAPHTLTVVGAGLTGCAIARCLAESGRRVVLIDTHPAPARGASAMPAMLARPYSERKPSAREQLYASAAAFARRRLSGLPGWTPTPIEVAGTPAVDGAIVEPAALCGHWIDHPAIEWRAATKVTRLERPADRWMLHTGTGVIEAEAVVLATADASELISDIPATRPVRGQLAHWPVATPPVRPVCDHGHVIPWNGGIIAGATYTRGSLNGAPCADDMIQLAELAQRLAPDAAPELNRGRPHVGIRRTTADRLPMIGPVPDLAAWRHAYADVHHGGRHRDWPSGLLRPNLWCSLGHGSRGATLAALQAEVLAAWILGWPSPLPAALLADIHPGRFWMRELKRRR